MSREELSARGVSEQKKKRTRCCPSSGRKRGGIGGGCGGEGKGGDKNGFTLLLYTSKEKNKRYRNAASRQREDTKQETKQ